jgi:hypothetical protein
MTNEGKEMTQHTAGPWEIEGRTITTGRGIIATIPSRYCWGRVRQF